MKGIIVSLFLFTIGLMLMLFSYLQSYPLGIDSPTDFVFNHVSVLFWISLSIMMPSLFLLALSCDNYYVHWFVSVAIFTTFYSIYYLYPTVPSADSSNFRGLTEYFAKTGDLTPNGWSRAYFQWPAFFILAKTTLLVSGIDLVKYEFLLFGIIGFLISTSVYIYASRFSKKGGFIAVIAFAIVLFSFLNYQAAPYTLALAILLLMFVLDNKPISRSSFVVLLVMFLSICLMHAFVAVFFILYLVIRYIVERKPFYRNFFSLSLILYLLTQINLASVSFGSMIHQIFTLPSDYSSYSSIVSSRLVPAKVPIDILAQFFSRGITISLGAICLIGFVFLLVKRKLNHFDKSVLLTGIIYSGMGVVLNTIGYRALPLLFLPISLGVLYLFCGKLKPYLSVILLVMLVFVTFIPVHNSFINYPIQFQTEEQRTASKFLIERFNWGSSRTIFTDVGPWSYIFPQVNGSTNLRNSQLDPNFDVTDYDNVLYTLGLEMTLNVSDSSPNMLNEFDVIYDSGMSHIVKNPLHVP